MTARGTEAPMDREKQFSQIIVPARDAGLYVADGWERVEEQPDGQVAVRKRLPAAA